MPDVLLLLVGLAVAGASVVLPLTRRDAVSPPVDDERAADELRHRVALEALRDVEADRRAGSLDDAAYASQLAEAEAHAHTTRSALERSPTEPIGRSAGRGIVVAGFVAATVAAILVVGSLFPGAGIANQTRVDENLAAARDAETARQDRIDELLQALAADATNPQTLSDLADAYLAGTTREDLVRAAVSLQILIELEPERVDAYERIMAAYLRAGDAPNARAAHDSYAALDNADPAEVAFFDGLIALRGEGDPRRAVAAFDQFLEIAPDDPRAAMIRGLREEAAAGG